MSRARALPFLVALALGCGPTPGTGDGGSSTGGSSGSSSEGTTTGTPPASSTSSTTADGSATDPPDPSGYEDDDGGTGCTFTCPDPPPSGGGGVSFACDIVAQDCPEGQKCMPYANDFGGEWNATGCLMIAHDPGAPGEPCTVDWPGATSGSEDCELGAVCWQVDPATNQGACHAICDEQLGVLVCDAPAECVTLEGYVPLCVQPCDPLAPACPPGMSCSFMDIDLVCHVVPGVHAKLGQPCGPAMACEPGTLCAYDPAVSCGNGLGMGCCSTPCDVNDPMTCMGLEVCVPWFPIQPPPELAYLGICAAP